MGWINKLFCKHEYETVRYSHSCYANLTKDFPEMIAIVSGTPLAYSLYGDILVDVYGYHSDDICCKCHKTRLTLTKELTKTVNHYFKFNTDKMKKNRAKTVKSESDNFFLKNIKVG